MRDFDAQSTLRTGVIVKIKKKTSKGRGNDFSLFTQLYLTGFGGNIQAITEEVYKEYKNWDVS